MVALAGHQLKIFTQYMYYDFVFFRIQTEENVEISQWYNKKYSSRDSLPWGNYL